MKQKINEKLRAITLRGKGYSLNEIVTEIGVAKSSISIWVRNVPLTIKARNRLLTRIKQGQLISAENKRRRTKAILDFHFQNAVNEIKQQKFNKSQVKTICALLYWCEGIKNHFNGISFINSDPKLIKTFLNFFRRSFTIEEGRLRASLHLHEYHNPKKQINFWSKITEIPKGQFIKPYLKPNTGKRIRKDYPGCIAIRYPNNDIARQLLKTAEAFFKKFGGMV